MSVHKYKIVFVGDQSVGKTSIMNRYTKDEFSLGNQPTVGVDFVSKSIQMEGKTVRLQLWDTAGQERFRSLIPSYIRDSHVIILVYDICCQKSFNSLDRWLNYIKEERGDNEVVLFLVANKYDTTDRQVDQQMGQDYKDNNPIINQFKEVSAKTNYQLADVFKEITQILLLQNNELDQSYSIPIQKYQLELNKKGTDKVNKKCTC